MYAHFERPYSFNRRYKFRCFGILNDRSSIGSEKNKAFANKKHGNYYENNCYINTIEFRSMQLCTVEFERHYISYAFENFSSRLKFFAESNPIYGSIRSRAFLQSCTKFENAQYTLYTPLYEREDFS